MKRWESSGWSRTAWIMVAVSTRTSVASVEARADAR